MSEKEKEYWAVDDGTLMPIICESEEQAKNIVDTFFDEDYDRIYKVRG